MIRIIAGREFRALLGSPLGWGLAALSQFVLGWRFLQLVQRYDDVIEPQLQAVSSTAGLSEMAVAPFFQDSVLLVVLLLVVAVLGMRAVAEERAQGTLPLLFAAPVASYQIVLGKYLGLWAYLMLLLLVWGLMPTSLLLAAPIDLGRLAASLLGLAAFASAMLALATLASALTRQPGLAAALSFVFGLLLMLFGQGASGSDSAVLVYLAPQLHYAPFLQGLISTQHLAYFALVLGGALALAVRRLDSLRVLA